MSKLNNPAGRLHALLVDFDARASKSVVINTVWCQVLDVRAADLMPALGRVAALLADIRAAVELSGLPELVEVHEQFSAAWAVPIFSHGRNPSGEHSGGLVERGALVALGSLSINLNSLSDGGVIPDDEVTTGVKAQLAELLDELAADSDLPTDLRAVIAARVHDITWAMDHVRIVGPEGVQVAIERLVGQLAIFTMPSPDVRQTGMFQRAMQVAIRSWTAFRGPGDVHQALEGWREVIELLPPS